MQLEELLEDGKGKYQWDLCLDETERCHFTTPSGTDLTLEKGPEPGTFSLYTIIGKLCPTSTMQYFITLLEANLFRQKTGKAQFGYDTSAQNVVLFQEFIEDHTTTESLLNDISLFISYMEYWKEELEMGSEAIHNNEIHLMDGQITSLIGKQNKKLFFV